jgi:hypothetical protein
MTPFANIEGFLFAKRRWAKPIKTSFGKNHNINLQRELVKIVQNRYKAGANFI